MAINDRDVPLCHIYGQCRWHSPVSIEGTKDALEAIRDAIEVALEDGRAESSTLFVTDGEGYHVEVRVRDFDYLETTTLPYIAPMAAGVGHELYLAEKENERKIKTATAKMKSQTMGK